MTDNFIIFVQISTILSENLIPSEAIIRKKTMTECGKSLSDYRRFHCARLIHSAGISIDTIIVYVYM